MTKGQDFSFEHNLKAIENIFVEHFYPGVLPCRSDFIQSIFQRGKDSACEHPASTRCMMHADVCCMPVEETEPSDVPPLREVLQKELQDVDDIAQDGYKMIRR